MDIAYKRLRFERDLCVWKLRQYAGAPRAGSHPVFWGLVQGASDLLGVLAPNGRLFCLEAKTGKARQRPGQREFAEQVRRLGGFYAVVHDIGEVLAALKRAREGATE